MGIFCIGTLGKDLFGEDGVESGKFITQAMTFPPFAVMAMEQSHPAECCPLSHWR